jgi:hypothetical protein
MWSLWVTFDRRDTPTRTVGLPSTVERLDLILAARIIALVEFGVLEGRGDLMNIQGSEVRLRNQALSDGNTV